MHYIYIYICMIYIDLSVVSPEIPIRALQILAKLVVVTWHDGILWTQICPPKSTENIEVTRFEWSLSRLWSWCLVPKYFGFLCNFFLGWRGWLRLWVGDLLQRNCWLLVCLVHFFLQWGVCWIDWFIFWGFDSAKSGASTISPFFFRRVFSNYRWICSWHADFHSSKTVGWKNEISSCIPSGLFTKYDSAGFPCGFHVFSTEVLLLKGFIGLPKNQCMAWSAFYVEEMGKIISFLFQWFPPSTSPFQISTFFQA